MEIRRNLRNTTATVIATVALGLVVACGQVGDQARPATVESATLRRTPASADAVERRASVLTATEAASHARVNEMRVRIMELKEGSGSVR